MIKNKNVLITGISGFVGSKVARLLAKDNNVFGLVNDLNVKTQLPDNVKLIHGDLTNFSDISKALDASHPDFVFHLGAIAFMPTAFEKPFETTQVNFNGTLNLLENVRIKKMDPKIIFAGSSEEYGLIISSNKHYKELLKKYGYIFPEPEQIPELPVKETNPLRPMMSYGVSKLSADFLMRDYYYTYGLKTIVSRSFNHEGAGRSTEFVTSAITKQVSDLKKKVTDRITIGNINVFRDWSHVNDTIAGYLHLLKNGRSGDVYNIGSMRTNSVLSYILLSLEQAGYKVNKLMTVKGNKRIDNPAKMNKDKFFGISFDKTKADSMMLSGEISFESSDKMIRVDTDKGEVNIGFDSKLFRPLDVPIVLSDTTKLQKTGFKIKHSLTDIIKDQLDYFNKKSDL